MSHDQVNAESTTGWQPNLRLEKTDEEIRDMISELIRVERSFFDHRASAIYPRLLLDTMIALQTLQERFESLQSSEPSKAPSPTSVTYAKSGSVTPKMSVFSAYP